MMKKMFHFLIVLLLLALLAAICWGLTKIYLWPWWVGATIGASTIALFLVGRFLRRHLLQRREKRFVQNVLQQDQDSIKKLPQDYQPQLIALREQWQQAIDQLRHSHLRRHGNPLYALPWYLVLGESGAGKSTAIKHSGLSTALTEVHHIPGVSSTKHCDWWFFEEAIVLDAAGRYAIPLDPGPDQQEWETFLELVAQYRRREPFNGVLLTIAADRLQNASEKELEEEGQQLRQRLDQLMRVTCANAPIYLLITKADLIYGFEEFSAPLNNEQLSQAMGYLGTERHQSWQELLACASSNIQKRLGELSQSLLKQGHSTPGSLLFPSELEALYQPLQAFIHGLANPNPYQETPLLRGLFFSSARHEGNAESLLMGDLSLPAEGAQDHDQSIFLQDIFRRILPQERFLFQPIAHYLRRKRHNTHLAWLLWGIICVGIASGMTISWQQQQQQLYRLQQNFLSPPTLCTDLCKNLLTLDRLRQEIAMLEQDLLPIPLRFGLRGSEEIIERLRLHYVKLFHAGFLEPLDQKLDEQLQQLIAGQGSAGEIAEYTTFLSAKIQLLSAIDRPDTERAYLEQYSTRVLHRLDSNLTPDMATRFIPCLLSYLNWSPTTYDITEETQRYRASLISLLQGQNQSLHWLVDQWIPDADAITQQRFWVDMDLPKPWAKMRIEPAFTQAGYNHIKGYIDFLKSTLGNQHNVLEKPLQRFWPWYEKRYLQAWLNFLRQTPLLPGDLHNEPECDKAASRQSMAQPPSWKLLQCAVQELEPWRNSDQLPAWFEKITRITNIIELANMEEEQRKPSLLSRLSGATEEAVEKATESLTKENRQQLHQQLQRSFAWDHLNKALLNCQALSQTPDMAADLCQQAFLKPQTSNALVLLQQQQTNIRQHWTTNEVPDWLWQHILQPGNYLLDWALQQSGHVLEQQWQQQVLGQMIGVDPQRYNRTLFAHGEGLAWRFLDNQATAFVQRTENGFQARCGLGRVLPLKADFFNWLNQGRRLAPIIKNSYTIELDCLPTNVNAKAKVEPYAVILTLHCNKGPTTLQNFNYSTSQTFTWSPDLCGDTELTIQFPEFSLQRRYSGSLGFAKLLAELADGHHRYSIELWPKQMALCQLNNLKWIDVNYRVTGASDVVQLLQQPTQIPDRLLEER